LHHGPLGFRGVEPDVIDETFRSHDFLGCDLVFLSYHIGQICTQLFCVA
jgi:hypothetical protein